MRNDELPAGWDEQRVQRVLDHYEGQTEAEAAEEDERALEDKSQTVMEIPRELVPAVRELIARHQARSA
jgi:type II secretory pathway component PulC